MAILHSIATNEHLLHMHLWQLCTSPTLGAGVHVDRNALTEQAPGWEQDMAAVPMHVLFTCLRMEHELGLEPLYALHERGSGLPLPERFFFFGAGPADLDSSDVGPGSAPLLFTGCTPSPYAGWAALYAPGSVHIHTAQGIHTGVSATWSTINREGPPRVHFLPSGLVVLAGGDDHNGPWLHVYRPGAGVLKPVLLSTMAQLDELDAVQIPWCLQDLDQGLLDDRDVVLRCLQHPGVHDLAPLSDRLKDDPEVAHAAVARGAWNYAHLPPNRRSDRALALHAASMRPDVVRLFPEELLADRPFVRQLVQVAPRTIHALPDGLIDRELVALAGATHPEAFAHDVHAAPPGYFQHRENVLRIVRTRGQAIEQLDALVIRDEEVMLAALRSAPACAAYLHQCGLATRARVVRWVTELPQVLAWLPAWVDDEEVGLCAVRTHGSALQYLSERLRNNAEIVTEACAREIAHVRHAGEALLRGDAELRALLARVCAEEEELPF
ncbi:MAG: DUF4116 domain-containing protein [Flavobacteriales bacterium]